MNKKYYLILLLLFLTACNFEDGAGSPSGESTEADSSDDSSEPTYEQPGKLILSKSSEDCEIGSSVYIAVETDMGNDASFSVSPALPKGLEFNLFTGDITGYALEPKAAETYTVTAAGDGWSRNAEFSLTITSTPPNGYRDIGGYWVEPDDNYYICGTDSDCGGSLYCNPLVPRGICVGCNFDLDCPGSLECLYSVCLQPCIVKSDCGDAQSCNNGYCGALECAVNSDCGDNYYCHHNDGDEVNGGRCYRKPVQ